MMVSFWTHRTFDQLSWNRGISFYMFTYLDETTVAIDLEFLIKKVLESMHFILFTALFPWNQKSPEA